MISSHDDFPIHQTSDPIVHPLTSDLNYYDRYGFSGFATSGEFMFEIAHGIYPNRQVADAAVEEPPMLQKRDGRVIMQTEPRGLHVQPLCRAHMGNRVGVGLCEQGVFGPHAPSGFKEFLDGAS